MLIKDLFTKPIDRPINGVIKADQDDAASVWQELDEYVITRELDIHFRTFFGAYLDAIERAGEVNVIGLVGIWISGFFGSGKSHFLKILSYLLENRAVTWNGQTRRAIDFFDGKIQDAMLAGDIKRAVSTDVDVILFNIDSKADSGSGRDTILRVFLKVFNQKLGYTAIIRTSPSWSAASTHRASWTPSRLPFAPSPGLTGNRNATATASMPMNWCKPCRRRWAKLPKGHAPGSTRRRTISNPC
jgi:hypothetical protein